MEDSVRGCHGLDDLWVRATYGHKNNGYDNHDMFSFLLFAGWCECVRNPMKELPSGCLWITYSGNDWIEANRLGIEPGHTKVTISHRNPVTKVKQSEELKQHLFPKSMNMVPCEEWLSTRDVDSNKRERETWFVQIDWEKCIEVYGLHIWDNFGMKMLLIKQHFRALPIDLVFQVVVRFSEPNQGYAYCQSYESPDLQRRLDEYYNDRAAHGLELNPGDGIFNT